MEPDPVAFGRLASLSAMMRDGLVDAGLMYGGEYDWETGEVWEPEERTRWVMEYYLDMVDRLAGIAADELEGKPLSTEDNEWLTFFGEKVDWLVSVVWLEPEPAPIVADIFLDPFADEVLEVATGPQDWIHVLVPNDDGAFQVASGAVYAYYEFWGPRDNRLTDEEWWTLIVAGDLPDRPSWWLDEHG